MIFHLLFMKKNIKERFPEWCRGNDHYNMVLGNDIDSLLSCLVLQNVKGYDINWFYDFNSMYAVDKNDRTTIIGADIAFANRRAKSWDNHVTLLSEDAPSNKNIASLNNIYGISRENYTKKYAMSTVTQIWSYYDIPLPKDEEAQMVLLAIDTGFKGYYEKTFQKTHREWLEILGFEGFEELEKILSKHSREDFYDVIRKYRLHEKIYIDGSKLRTNIDIANLNSLFRSLKIELPTYDFNLHSQYKEVHGSYNAVKNVIKNKKIISYAFTRRDYVNITYVG